MHFGVVIETILSFCVVLSSILLSCLCCCFDIAIDRFVGIVGIFIAVSIDF